MDDDEIIDLTGDSPEKVKTKYEPMEVVDTRDTGLYVAQSSPGAIVKPRYLNYGCQGALRTTKSSDNGKPVDSQGAMAPQPALDIIRSYFDCIVLLSGFK
ncbi:hypothetical protein M514_05025 [Trichuris suis]|uniref:Uncharacterized protein n=1 Tax=Trichuris suis TaxID=68888 RepID=A0A085NCX3_9BILA|nr:hypothetical protein M513_05025 [Trichuris suis]KFD67319.1 hypothetical protein M514_05025 [Trichuris suis]